MIRPVSTSVPVTTIPARTLSAVYGQLGPLKVVGWIPLASMLKLAGFFEWTRWGLPSRVTVAAPPLSRSSR